ncbi:MAG: TatD family hydrolase, partial [Pseudorhodoplanes sp.]|nr:TatD family hydrolase [Pseudorhodoplanes sp.]
CHLDLYSQPEQVVRECVARELYVLSVTTTPSAWGQSSALVEGADRIRCALGLHPELAHERKGELELFDALLPQARYVGEIGLDGSPVLKRHWADQVHVFEHILATCKSAGGRIMTIHSRRAVSAVLERLADFDGAGTPILHWYSGGHADLQKALDLGCWFSVGPGMVSSERGKALVARMPQDRVLTETDGPFAIVDGRNAAPWDVDKAVAALADVWKISQDDVAGILDDNLRRLVERL